MATASRIEYALLTAVTSLRSNARLASVQMQTRLHSFSLLSLAETGIVVSLTTPGPNSGSWAPSLTLRPWVFDVRVMLTRLTEQFSGHCWWCVHIVWLCLAVDIMTAPAPYGRCEWRANTQIVRLTLILVQQSRVLALKCLHILLKCRYMCLVLFLLVPQLSLQLLQLFPEGLGALLFRDELFEVRVLLDERIQSGW